MFPSGRWAGQGGKEEKQRAEETAFLMEGTASTRAQENVQCIHGSASFSERLWVRKAARKSEARW